MPLLQAIVIIFFVSLSVPFTLGKYAENCVTPVGEEGKCMPLKSCAGAFEILQNAYKYGEEKFKNEMQFLQESRCDSSDETPLICCPEENIQMNPYVYDHFKNLSCGNSGGGRVAKGAPAGLFEFRWMAMLVYNGKEKFACGGSLIDDRHVLTAAHCLHDMPYAVRLGEYDLNNETDCTFYGSHKKCLDAVQDIRIEKYIVHEDYIHKGLHHDIAIVRLERPVNFTKSIRPICLPISEKLQAEIPEEFLVAGWGLTEYGNRSNVLLWTSIPLQTNDFCHEKLDVTLTDEHICAGGKHFNDTCKGDSGGPQFYPNFYVDGVVRTIQYGIVSLGSPECGKYNFPAIYTNVGKYMQWISDHIILEDEYSATPTTPTELEIIEILPIQFENSAFILKENGSIFLLLLLSIFLQSSFYS